MVGALSVLPKSIPTGYDTGMRPALTAYKYVLQLCTVVVVLLYMHVTPPRGVVDTAVLPFRNINTAIAWCYARIMYSTTPNDAGGHMFMNNGSMHCAVTDGDFSRRD